MRSPCIREYVEAANLAHQRAHNEQNPHALSENRGGPVS
jgi:hypothetical protein